MTTRYDLRTYAPRHVAAFITIASAAVGLAACAPGDATEEASGTSSPTAAVTVSETKEVEAALLDVDGDWCPTAPAVEGDPGCLVASLPELTYEGSGSPEYLYLTPGDDVDPREYTDADLHVDPDLGECWEATVDGYPRVGGAALVYCPADAVSGLAWIDDPVGYFGDAEWMTEDVVDRTREDRLYLTQEETPYPYVRSEA